MEYINKIIQGETIEIMKNFLIKALIFVLLTLLILCKLKKVKNFFE